jgi:hypothetical protein
MDDMRLPSASQLHIANHCVWLFWSDEARWSSDHSEAADMGQLFHAHVANNIDAACFAPTLNVLRDEMTRAGGFEISDSNFAIVKRWCDVWERDAATILAERSSLGTELVFAYNPETDEARLLSDVHPRKAWEHLLPGEQSGAADVVLWEREHPGAPHVVLDWKTGVLVNGEPVSVDPIATHAQMRFLGLAVARVYLLESVQIVLAYIDEDGIRAETATLGEEDFSAIRADLQSIQARIKDYEEPNPGEWCKWCPARASCPTTAAAIGEMLPTLLNDLHLFRVVADTASIRSPEHATWMLGILRRVEMAVEDVESALRGWVNEHGGIHTESGMWHRKEIPIERIELNVAGLEIMSKLLPEAVRPVTSKKAIMTAARARRMPPQEIVERIMTELREVGATVASTQVRYEE